MKKIIFIVVVLFSFTAQSQKTVYVLNFSSLDVYIGEIQSKSTNNGYPRYKSNLDAGSILVEDGDIYFLATPNLTTPNTTRFPLYSPTSTPAITSWRRQNSSGAVWSIPLNSIILNTNPIANPQEFYLIKFQVGLNGIYGGDTLFGQTDNGSGSNWEAFLETIDGETVIYIYDL